MAVWSKSQYIKKNSKALGNGGHRHHSIWLQSILWVHITSEKKLGQKCIIWLPLMHYSYFLIEKCDLKPWVVFQGASKALLGGLSHGRASLAVSTYSLWLSTFSHSGLSADSIISSTPTEEAMANTELIHRMPDVTHLTYTLLSTWEVLTEWINVDIFCPCNCNISKSLCMKIEFG